MKYLYLFAALTAALFLSYWISRKRRLERKIEKTPFPERWREILREKVAFYNGLSHEESAVFEKRIQLFLARKRITGIGTEVDDTDRVLIASSAVIPIFGFPEWEYGNLDEVLLYPSSFDEEYLSGEGGHIAGMAGAGGWSNTMILSRADLHSGFARPGDGSNVGIHEFIHYIDMADGEVDGIPSLLLEKSFVIPWLKLIKNEIEDIEKGRSDINPYGASSDIEFFAVAAEYFFEKPKKLKNDHPELYGILNSVFRQDSASRIGRNLFKKKKKRKPGRNDPCPCGSGKKYKKCCLK
jgi:MtfA peptidase